MGTLLVNFHFPSAFCVRVKFKDFCIFCSMHVESRTGEMVIEEENELVIRILVCDQLA